MKRIKCISALLTLMFLFCVGTVEAQSKSFGQTQIKKEAIRIAPKTADAPSSEAKTLQASPKRLMTNGKSVESAISNRKAATAKKAVSTNNAQPTTTVIEGKQESPKRFSVNGQSASGTISKNSTVTKNTSSTMKKAELRNVNAKKAFVSQNVSALKAKGTVNFNSGAFETARDAEVRRTLDATGYSSLVELKKNDIASYKQLSGRIHQLRSQY